MSVESDLSAYEALLRKWNAVQNLVSRETLGKFRARHIEDSLQVLPLLRATDRRIIDIGSGGGLPAIPLAIASRGAERRYTLVEPIAKKASFLRTAARELQLPLTVLATRAEEIDSRETYEAMTSRALAPLVALMPHISRFLVPEGHALLHKGRNYRQELDAAAAQYDFDVVVHASRTDPEAAILEIGNLRSKSVA